MILIKIGGGKNINLSQIAKDIADLAKKEAVVVLHGASATRDIIAQKLGIPTKTIVSPSGVSSVYTDNAAIDVFLMSYCGLVNKKIVAMLQKYGVNAVGLSGIDGRLWEAKRKEFVYATENNRTKLITDNLTGRVENVNSKLILLLCENGFVPVICPPAISYEHEIVNTDNDTAASMMAQKLDIDRMVFLFEASGLLRNPEDNTSVIRNIKLQELDQYMDFAKGRMKKKLLGAKKALLNGVSTVYFSDGRIEKPVTSALKGKGTVITKS